MQLGTKMNYKVVEEKLLGFDLVYKLACTELPGSDSFVKFVSRRAYSGVLQRHPKCFVVSYHGFNKKK